MTADAPRQTAPLAEAASPRPRRGLAVAPYALVALIVLVALFFSVWGPTAQTFPTVANLQSLIGNQAVLLVVAVAALVPLVCLEFDLSVGSTLAASSIACAASFQHLGSSVPLAVAVAVLVGAAVGVVNGVLVGLLGVNSLIVTLGVSTVLTGLISAYTGGQSLVDGIPVGFTDFGAATLLGVPTVVYLALLIAGAVWWLLSSTPYGRWLYAIGSNPRASRLIGLRVDRSVLFAFVASGTLAGLAGAMQLAHSGVGAGQVAGSFSLNALNAAFLSAAAIMPGRFNVPGAVVAILFLATITSGLNLAGLDAWVNDVVNGTALVIGVGLATLLNREKLGRG